MRSALTNLKEISRGKTVGELVRRAAVAKGLDVTGGGVKGQAGVLYTVRSKLSHTGSSDIPDVQAARGLVELVLDPALLEPSLLDTPTESGATTTN